MAREECRGAPLPLRSWAARCSTMPSPKEDPTPMFVRYERVRRWRPVASVCVERSGDATRCSRTISHRHTIRLLSHTTIPRARSRYFALSALPLSKRTQYQLPTTRTASEYCRRKWLGLARSLCFSTKGLGLLRMGGRAAEWMRNKMLSLLPSLSPLPAHA